MRTLLTKRRVVFAFIMSIITGSMTVTANILYNFGLTPDFLRLWLHTVVVVYPTIMFSILFIGPHVQRAIERRLA